MNTADVSRTTPPFLPGKRLAPQFLGMMLVYCAVVYAWMPQLYPLGRDYAAMSSLESLPWLARTLFAWELHRFGTWSYGYFLVNMLLLYACMVTVFFCTRLVVRGLWWLGSLAAVLMMANPLKSEAVLHLSGVQDLLPAWLALLALLFHALHLRHRRWWIFPGALVVFALAVLPFRANQALFLVIACMECVMVEKGNRLQIPVRLIPFFLLSLVAMGAQGIVWRTGLLTTPASILPLWLVFYPIGLLPETAAWFYQFPILAALAGLAIVFLIFGIHRLSRNAAMFGLALGACAWCAWQSMQSVDLVQMNGGGAMIVPMALLTMAFAALCGQIQRLPKWRRPIVFLTTLLCAVFFVLQARSNLAWVHAGGQVRAFQEQIAEAAARHPGETFGVAPDYQYHLGAPVRLSESVRYDTPIGPAIKVMSVLPINYVRSPALQVCVLEWSATEARIEVRGASPHALAPPPYLLTRPGIKQTISEVDVFLESAAVDSVIYRVRPTEGTLPLYRVEQAQ